MSVSEFLLRVLTGLEPVLPGLIAAAVATLAAFFVLLLLCRNTWVGEKGFRLVGIFFGLNGRGSVRLACAWLKLIFLLVFVLSFQKLTLLHYLMMALPGVILTLCGQGLSGRLRGFLWLLLQTAGLLSVNLVCGYIRDMSGGMGFLLLYIAMGLFLILFSLYLFLNELAGISAQRDVDARQIWG